MKALLFILSICSFVFGADRSSIYIAPVQPTPESDQVYLRIVFPKGGAMEQALPISAQLRLEGYSLSTYSEFPRANRLYNNPEGQCVQVVIDNEPHFPLYVSFEDSFDENRNFLDKIISFHIPKKMGKRLDKGEHVIRVFPVRSFFESLKNPHAYDVSIFYVESTTPSLNLDLRKPYLTYNMPQGIYPADNASPILLDFLIANAKLSKDGYKVRVSIDESFESLLTYPAPYFIYGLERGEHTIVLELLDENNKVVNSPNGLFNTTKRTIIIE